MQPQFHTPFEKLPDRSARAFRLPHALVMEDDANISARLADILGDMGYDCTVEETETGAIAAAMRRRPELMIVDVRLAEGSGLDAVEEICRIGPIPHVIITGFAPRLNTLRRDSILIRKPFNETVFVLAIRTVLDDL